MNMLEQGGWIGVLISKFGFIKIMSMGSALLGAAIMAAFKPPRTRKEVFIHGAVALGTAVLFGGTAVSFLDYMFDWINLASAPLSEVINFNITIHGLMGAVAWGFWGGLSVMRDRFYKDPTSTIKEIKDNVLS